MIRRSQRKSTKESPTSIVAGFQKMHLLDVPLLLNDIPCPPGFVQGWRVHPLTASHFDNPLDNPHAKPEHIVPHDSAFTTAKPA